MGDRLVAGALGLVRSGIGVAFLAAPRPLVELWVGKPAGRAAALTARSVGGRDLALGLGVLRSLDNDGALAAWLMAGAVADASDALAIVADYRDLPAPRRLAFLASASAATIVAVRVARRLR
jgi:hypothetical protein